MMYIFNNEQVISGRSVAGRMMPQRNLGSQLRILNVTSTPEPNTIVYRFARPLAANGDRTTALGEGKTDMIWAVSDSPVISEDSMSKHSDSGTMSLNLFEVSPSKNMTKPKSATTPAAGPAKATGNAAASTAAMGVSGALTVLAAALVM